MRKLVVILGLVTVSSPPTAAKAQIAAPNRMGVSMAHINLLASDADAANRFWLTLGGTAASHGPLHYVTFPGVLVVVRKADPSAAAAGSVVDHFGFYVANLRQSMAKWKAAGLATEPCADAHQCYMTTPDGLIRIDIVEKTSLSVPIVFAYVYFRVLDTGTSSKTTMSEMQAWYAKVFGATSGKQGGLDSGDLPGGTLLFARAETRTTGTEGRAVDHIGFEVSNLEAFYRRAEANGVKFDRPFTPRPEMDESLTYVTDPWGTRIELNDGVARW